MIFGQPSNSKKSKKAWYSGTGVAIVLVSVISAVSFYAGTRYELTAGALKTDSQAGISAYKKGPFGGELPASWSVLSGPGLQNEPVANDSGLISPDSLVASFSPATISEGDGAFEQVDFYVITKTVANSLLSKAAQSGDSVSKEAIGGVPATVISYPTDNGVVDKDGSGGKDYLLSIGTSPSKFLLMRDWSLGSAAFESGFRHFNETVDFTSGW